MAVDTSKVKGRREIRFASLSEVLADAQRLVTAEESGTLRRLGNWSLGRALGHLAHWIDMPYDGYPTEVQPPWFVKIITRMMKKKILNDWMPAGGRIPGLAEGTLGTAELLAREGLERLRKACAKLEAGPPPRENPLFGKLTHDEWKRLNLAHAGLHLSFFVPG
jgi:Protein of unknown function (DUF1569)